MVWVIDPRSRTAGIYQCDEARIMREHDELYTGAIAGSFCVPLRAVLT